MDDGARVTRNELFQELKPYCVDLLSKLALQDDGSITNAKALLESTTRLLRVLETKCRRSDGIFDEKLADYVFFPLSHILRSKQSYTDQLSELTIRCVRILLEYGWRKSIALDLSKQLLILLTFVVGGIPGKQSVQAPEELLIEGYAALAALFRTLAVTIGGPQILIESGVIPALGHCVTVILDGVTDGPSPAVQLQALRTLDAMWSCVKDPEPLSTFLPGTVSALTKCLMPTTGTRRTKTTIVQALKVFEHVLVSLLGDMSTRNIRQANKGSDGIASPETEKKTLTASWLNATTAQVKLALSNVIRLRRHESTEVTAALSQFCIAILDECHDSMSDSAAMLVETSMMLVDVDEDTTGATTTIQNLALIHPDIGDCVKNTVYNWVTSLPRIMQANDETAKRTALEHLSKAQGLLTSLDSKSTTLGDALGNALRDSITNSLQSISTVNGVEEAVFDLNSQAAVALASEYASATYFSPVIMSEESQRPVRVQFLAMLSSIGSRESQLEMASEMIEYARRASGPGLLSAYWLSFQIVRSAASANKDFDELFESSLTMSNEQETINQELFSYSLSLLTDSEESSDWRLKAVALEAIADSAQRLKDEFRTELVDVLYPIAQLLGSPISKLREHAITCLNIISGSCGYRSASDLIVSNVDYMVNAISLRLNTFDISPQAPQVLVMMIRLTGPSLLLYLDDVVESIFAALDNFHGYHRLVEALFAVLGEIVSVGSKSDQLRIEYTTPPSHHKTGPKAISTSELLELMKPKKRHPENLEHEDHPRVPWKSAKTLLDEAQASSEPPESEAEAAPGDQSNNEIVAPPPTKTYSMLRSITHLSQHYLTSSSPHLRAKLLNLITTSSTALSFSEDNFLPLTNDIWPVVIKRLYDKESYVQIAATECISSLCQSAGDFLGTRIQDEYSSMIKFARQARVEAEKENRKEGGGRGRYSQAVKVWEAVASLLVSVVQYVQVPDEIFDGILEVLGSLLGRSGVREAMEVVNADAVWLALQMQGKNADSELPVFVGYQFVVLPTVNSR